MVLQLLSYFTTRDKGMSLPLFVILLMTILSGATGVMSLLNMNKLPLMHGMIGSSVECSGDSVLPIYG